MHLPAPLQTRRRGRRRGTKKGGQALTVALGLAAGGGWSTANVLVVIAAVVLRVLSCLGGVDLGLVEHDRVGRLRLSHVLARWVEKRRAGGR